MSDAEPWWVAEGRAREIFRADEPGVVRWGDLTPEQRAAYRQQATQAPDAQDHRQRASDAS
jgi:hypothetical protein